MKTHEHVQIHRISQHVLQLQIPTPTLPPSYHTNSYIVHDRNQALVVDAGSTDPQYLSEVLGALTDLGDPGVIGLVATHYHRDHTHGLPYLQLRTKAPIYIHVDDYKAVRAELTKYSDSILEIAEVPPEFKVGGITVLVEHHPGHTRGHIHLCIPDDRVILVGDHLAGDGSVWIGPPDGNMDQYYKALDSIAASDYEIAGPGHGPAIPGASKAALALKHRRLEREQQILHLVSQKPHTVEEVFSELYAGTIPDSAQWVAKKTITAHLERLIDLDVVTSKSESDGPWYQGR